jgi:hypothetical protein
MDSGQFIAAAAQGVSRLRARHVLEGAALAVLAGGCCAVGLMTFDPAIFSFFSRAGLERAGTAFLLGGFGGAGTYFAGLYRTLPRPWSGEERRKH